MTDLELADEIRKRWSAVLWAGENDADQCIQLAEYVGMNLPAILAALRRPDSDLGEKVAAINAMIWPQEIDEAGVERAYRALLDADFRGMELGRTEAFRETVRIVIRAYLGGE